MKKDKIAVPMVTPGIKKIQKWSYVGEEELLLNVSITCKLFVCVCVFCLSYFTEYLVGKALALLRQK